MSLTGPMATFFGLVERKTRLVEMLCPSEIGVTAYRVYGAASPNVAYGDPSFLHTSGVSLTGPTLMFEVNRDAHYVSRTLRRSGRITGQDSKRNQTWATFDIMDFLVPGVALPPDGDWLFVRAQEFRSSIGAWVTFDTGEAGGPDPQPQLGPIYCVPPADFFGYAGRPAFFLTGLAPAGTVCAAGAVPAFNDRWQDALGNAVMNPMHLVFPRPVSEVTLTNLDGANPLLVSTGTGDQMIGIPFGQSVVYQDTSIKELVLAGTAGATVAFNLVASIGMES